MKCKLQMKTNKNEGGIFFWGGGGESNLTSLKCAFRPRIWDISIN